MVFGTDQPKCGGVLQEATPLVVNVASHVSHVKIPEVDGGLKQSRVTVGPIEGPSRDECIGFNRAKNEAAFDRVRRPVAFITVEAGLVR